MLGDFKTSVKNLYPVHDKQLTHVLIVLLEIGANISCTEIHVLSFALIYQFY